MSDLFVGGTYPLVYVLPTYFLFSLAVSDVPTLLLRELICLFGRILWFTAVSDFFTLLHEWLVRLFVCIFWITY